MGLTSWRCLLMETSANTKLRCSAHSCFRFGVTMEMTDFVSVILKNIPCLIISFFFSLLESLPFFLFQILVLQFSIT